MKMPEYFYFLSDKYCEQFADCEIMGNKEGNQNNTMLIKMQVP